MCLARESGKDAGEMKPESLVGKVKLRRAPGKGGKGTETPEMRKRERSKNDEGGKEREGARHLEFHCFEIGIAREKIRRLDERDEFLSNGEASEEGCMCVCV